MIGIRKYFCDNTYTVTSKTENVSNIIDKMIRLTAKLTESDASDIYYDIHALLEAVNSKTEMDNLLFFCEYGVSTEQRKIFSDEQYLRCKPIQIWRLTHNPNTTETILERV